MKNFTGNGTGEVNKREKIIAAALTEFCENDYRNASVNTIIKNAGTSKGNFYHFFRDKQELYIELLKEAWQKKMLFMGSDNGDDFFISLRNQVMAGIRFSRENPEYYRLSRRFSTEKNTEIYNSVIEEITGGSSKESGDVSTERPYPALNIRNDLPKDFVDGFISFILNNIDELISEEDDIDKIEEKLLYLTEVLQNGLKK